MSYKYETAPTLWAHSGGADKVTVVYNSFTQPNFVHRRFYTPFNDMMHDFPGLKIRTEPSTYNFPNLAGLVYFIRELKFGAPLPQLVFLGSLYPQDDE